MDAKDEVPCLSVSREPPKRGKLHIPSTSLGETIESVVKTSAKYASGASCKNSQQSIKGVKTTVGAKHLKAPRGGRKGKEYCRLSQNTDDSKLKKDPQQVNQVFAIYPNLVPHKFAPNCNSQPPIFTPLASNGYLATLGPAQSAGALGAVPLTPGNPQFAWTNFGRPLPLTHIPTCSGKGGAAEAVGGNPANTVAMHVGNSWMHFKQYPVVWQGLLVLKDAQAAVKMYYVSGEEHIAKMGLHTKSDGGTSLLQILLRMKLEPVQLEGVAEMMSHENQHCVLFALPTGNDPLELLNQAKNLSKGIITYLQDKQAAGIVNVSAQGVAEEVKYVVHIFPSCDFANENLKRLAPELLGKLANTEHLLIVITTV